MSAQKETAILITDCLQNDFVGRIGRFDSLPNALHIGYEESLRLLGEDPAHGPVARVIAWAHQQPDSRLRVVHIRDWHDPQDTKQHSHLEQFGAHCVKESKGAEFIFDMHAGDKELSIVNATTLSNFVDADLGKVLDQFANQPLRIGLMGVWTEAKLTFLAYDLRSRYPQCELAVCSALSASSSRQNHFLALDQLERILGVRVLASPGEFVDYLGGQMENAPLIGFSEKHPVLRMTEGAPLSPVDQQLARYLFRGCREVFVKSLDGGFSGNRVLAATSIDLQGHEETPHVLKIGAKGPIGQERASFERIESVLGNSAPRVADFADLGDRGAIKYRYAAMGRGSSKSLQKMYETGASEQEISRIFDAVFSEQLGRFYRAAQLESVDLLNYYQFSSRWSESVRSKVRELVGAHADDETLEFANGRRVLNIANFYARDLDALPRSHRGHHFAQVHGDLNGANIIVDAQGNVWLIDFFHSHRGHVIKDLAKFENDVLYIFTKIDSDDALNQALDLTDALLRVADLGKPLSVALPSTVTDPRLLRAWQTVKQLRSYYPSLVKADRDPVQLLIAQIRYAVHTLGFDESNEWQRKWALYTACAAAKQMSRRLQQSSELRIDWLPAGQSQGRLGLTWLPGRRDAGRDMHADIQRMQEQKVSAVLCLLAADEFRRYGVEGLLASYKQAGLEVLHVPIVDGSVPSQPEMQAVIDWIESRLQSNGNVVAHCVGGLGRAGTVAACWLKHHGSSADAAIRDVRDARSPRAIETLMQEEFVRDFSR